MSREHHLCVQPALTSPAGIPCSCVCSQDIALLLAIVVQVPESMRSFFAKGTGKQAGQYVTFKGPAEAHPSVCFATHPRLRTAVLNYRKKMHNLAFFTSKQYEVQGGVRLQFGEREPPAGYQTYLKALQGVSRVAIVCLHCPLYADQQRDLHMHAFSI